MSVFSAPHFHDEEAAFAFLEDAIWAGKPACPHCGSMDRITKVKANPEKRIRVGLHRCGDCKKQFRVTVGTVFEHGRVPLHKFLQAAYLLCCSKKGVSAHQLHRILEVTYKTAWFMAHRIREAMRSDDFSPMGGGGKVVESDDTFIGRLSGARRQKRGDHAANYKNTVLTLVERGGRARSFHISGTNAGQILPIVRANIARESHLMTDEARYYPKIGQEFAAHGMVDHSKKEYGRTEWLATGERIKVTTNTVEGYFSIFKRGMKGVYQHCSEKHLHRYLAEFDFRYSNRSALGVEDQERAAIALKGIKGKRLTYARPHTLSL